MTNNILDTVIQLVQEDDNQGICVVCNEVADGVEPDAENYECDACGAMAVCGAEQFLLMHA